MWGGQRRNIMKAKLATRIQERELLAWIIRKFPEGQVPAEAAQYLIDHPDELPELLLAMLVNRTIVTQEQLQEIISDWQKFFGHLYVWDSNFNETNFPLGVDPGDEAEEFGFDRLVTGHEAVAEFERMGREEASLWAQGRYIKANPQAQKDHPLLGTGARWQCWGRIWFPIFLHGANGLFVDLDSLDGRFYPDDRFLLRKKVA